MVSFTMAVSSEIGGRLKDGAVPDFKSEIEYKSKL